MGATAALMVVDQEVRRERQARVVALPVPPRRDGEASGADGAGGTSVQKALAVLEAFRGPGAVLGVTEVARRGQLSKSTAHRMLALLVDEGYVEREGSRYILGPKLFELGNAAAYARTRTLRSLAMPYMIELLQATQATVHLTTLVDGDLLYLERVYGHQGVRDVPHVGTRVPAAGTAPGDAMRAFGGASSVLAGMTPRLAAVRRRGYALQESALVHSSARATLCLSAPVVARSSRTAVAALSVVLRKNQHRAPSLGSDVQACAGRIAEVL
ncbi:MAG TPA: IclR family transcriptional regulator [Pseudonocardia sp.]|jgi:DNA-binding IclR family transcriptional regulator